MPGSREIHLIHSESRYLKLPIKGIRSQWAALRQFFQRCTDAQLPPRGATLHLVVEPGSARALASAVARARRLFGKPDVEKGDDDTSYQWEISRRQFDNALAYIEGGEPWYYDVLPTPALDFMPFFRLRDPLSGQLLPAQAQPPRRWAGQFATMLYASLGPEAFGWCDLRLPFQKADQSLLSFLKAFSSELPFRLPLNRLWYADPAKPRGTFRYRRLEPAAMVKLKSGLSR